MTRTIRRRFPVLFAAVALLALFGALALPATTQAQSAEVLVSNIGEDQEGVGHAMNDNRLLAQSFSVPSGGGNYTLTSIAGQTESQDFGFAARSSPNTINRVIVRSDRERGVGQAT